MPCLNCFWFTGGVSRGPEIELVRAKWTARNWPLASQCTRPFALLAHKQLLQVTKWPGLRFSLGHSGNEWTTRTGFRRSHCYHSADGGCLIHLRGIIQPVPVTLSRQLLRSGRPGLPLGCSKAHENTLTDAWMLDAACVPSVYT